MPHEPFPQIHSHVTQLSEITSYSSFVFQCCSTKLSPFPRHKNWTKEELKKKIYPFTSQIDFKLLCLCLVIDHRWLWNKVRTKKGHMRHRRMRHWYSYHNLRSSEIYYCTDPWQHRIYLFYVTKKRKIFLMVTSSMGLSSNRSWVRTTQNRSIIQLIIYSTKYHVSDWSMMNA